MNEQQSQNLWLKIDPLSTRDSQQEVEHERWETRNSQVKSFCIEYIVAALFPAFCRLYNTGQDIHFVL